MGIEIRMKLEGIDDLLKVLNETPQAFEDGARSGILKVTKDFSKQTKKIAPKKTGKLRASIKRDSRITGNIRGKGWVRGTVRAGATDLGFDYAAFHEYDFPYSSYMRPSTPGTQPQYFKKTIDKNLNDYEEILTEEIMKELRKAGW